MSSIEVRVNSFFQDTDQVVVLDPASKFYIIIENILGINRLPILLKGHRHHYFLLLLSYILTVICILWLFSLPILNEFDWPIWFNACFEYLLCSIYSLVTWKRISRFYYEINKFDVQVGCRPQTTIDAKRNLAVVVGFCWLFSLMHAVHVFVVYSAPFNSLVAFVLSDLVHSVELSYSGHILCLFAARIRLINYYMELALSNGHSAKQPTIQKFNSFQDKHKRNSKIQKLMHLYEIVVNIYDILIDAIQVQLLVILISTFLHSLIIFYRVISQLMNNKITKYQGIISFSFVLLQQILPIFSPCVFGERVRNEVRRLRELIATRIYENKLDKVGRRTARALLGLTEARDLSVSLLRMLRVDVSLPIKFIGLLVTYLIILLQFDRVLYPTIEISHQNVTS